MSKPEPATNAKPSAPPGGFKTKNLVIIGGVALLLWVMAIGSGSVVFISIVGALTVVAAGVVVWGWRYVNKQRELAALLQRAAESPEARAEAMAALSADKGGKQIGKVVARAQLVAAEDPAAALAMLEALDPKKVPVAIQDDVGLLQAQLYLSFGRAKEARPLADRINVDNPQRAEHRPMMVAIVAETWARTGAHGEAEALLDTVELDESLSREVGAQLIIARVFARFAAGKKGAARAGLKQLSAIDVNILSRFVAPQFKVHPGLQRLAREEAERNPQLRKMQGGQRRGRPR